MRFFIFIVLIFGPFYLIAENIYIKDIDADFSNFNSSNYEKLYNAHLKAIDEKLIIDYEGVDTIKLDISTSARPIPIPNVIDFKNVVLIVNNIHKDLTLFEYSNVLYPIEIDKNISVDSVYSSIKEFENKKILLVITDRNNWINERVGYRYNHIRKDLVVVENSIACNQTIQPYNNQYSDPTYSYCDITNDTIRFANLVFQRTDKSTRKTFCLKIQNANNIMLNNISITTPPSELYGDAALTFNNCANIKLSDVTINGTYSKKDKYGYGISMNNVYNCIFDNLFGDGKWGIFGTNNVNTAHLNNCNLNRFDIHCYGKDVFCSNTLFHTLYNQFSSFYGILKYDKCMFNKFIPVTIDGSFSAYTSFNVIFKDCRLEIDPHRPFLFNMSYSRFLIDSVRPELKKLSWPNLFIENMDIISNSNIDKLYIYHTYDNGIVKLDKMPIIEIQNLNFEFDKISLSNSIVDIN